MRGDGPDQTRSNDIEKESAPHAWGWTGLVKQLTGSARRQPHMRGDGPLRIRKLKTRERLASHARGYILFEKTMYKKAEVIKKKHMLCSAFSTPLEVSKISRLED